MPWNEPGKQDNKDSWGGQNPKGPPDLDKMLGELINRLRSLIFFKKKMALKTSWSPGSKGHHYGLGITLGVLILVWVLSGLFIVNPAENAVILRFGKFSEVLQPGLHWMARFIDTKYLVDVRKIYAFPLQGDFLTKSSDQNDLPNQYIQVASKNSLNDQSKNLVNVELNVQYRISNPRDYLFNLVNPDETIQHLASGAISDVVGKMKLDDVLTIGRESLSAGVLDRIRTVLKNYNPGLEVVAVNLRKVQAPDQVRAAFNDVNRADQDRATTIQQAQAYASKIVPIAQGAAARILADATGYQQQVVLGAQAHVAKYQALLKAYINSPDVTRERLYLEAIQNVLQKTSKVLVDVNGANNMLFLPLGKMLKQAEQNVEIIPTTSIGNGSGVKNVNSTN